MLCFVLVHFYQYHGFSGSYTKQWHSTVFVASGTVSGFLGFLILLPPGPQFAFVVHYLYTLSVFVFGVRIKQINTATSTAVNLEFYNIFAQEHVCKELSILLLVSVHSIQILSLCFRNTEKLFIFITLTFCYIVYRFLLSLFWACSTFRSQVVLSATLFALLTARRAFSFAFSGVFPQNLNSTVLLVCLWCAAPCTAFPSITVMHEHLKSSSPLQCPQNDETAAYESS